MPGSDSAIDIPAYIPKANGGVIPHITPQIHGSIAAIKTGFDPFAANKPINTAPKIVTNDEPGITIPIKHVIRGITRASPTLFIFNVSKNSPSSVVALISGDVISGDIVANDT